MQVEALDGVNIIEKEFPVTISNEGTGNSFNVDLPNNSKEIIGFHIDSQANEDLAYLRGRLYSFVVNGSEVFDSEGYLVKKLMGVNGAPDSKYKKVSFDVSGNKRVTGIYTDLAHAQGSFPGGGSYTITLNFKIRTN